MPGIVKIFCGGEDVVKFTPRNAEDIQASEQESEYINYIVTQKNDWVRILYAWAKDGLLQKNGYVKYFWEEKEDETKESYKQLSSDEFTLIMQDPQVEIVSHDQYEMPMQLPDGQVTTEMFHDAVFRRVGKYGCVKIEGVPPEEMLVDMQHREVCVKDANFVEHRTKKTIGELFSMGYKFDAKELQDDGTTELYESLHRDDFEETYWNDDGYDDLSRLVTVKDVYIRLGDGKKQTLYNLVIVGKKILDEREVEFVPFAVWTPELMPHRHIGRSMADHVMEIQLLKSTLLRNELDSSYLALHGRYAISDRVNMDDMMTSRPGGIVRVDGEPGNAIFPLTNAHAIGQAFPILEYLDTIKENRTGVTKYNQGLDSQSLNKTATGVRTIMGAAQERTLLVNRLLAEGVKDLFLGVHALTQKYQNKPEVIRLRNKWVTIDPREWVKRADMVVSVGLGTGDKEQQGIRLQAIGQYMQVAAQVGIVTPKNVYNLGEKMITNSGYKMPEEFITDPEGGQLPKQGPNPEQIQQMQQDMAKMRQELESANEALASANQAKVESSIKQTAMSEKDKLEQYEARLTEQSQALKYDKEVFRLTKEFYAHKEGQTGKDNDGAQQNSEADEQQKQDVFGDMIEQVRSEMLEAMQLVMQESTKKPINIRRVRDGKGRLSKAIMEYEDGTTRETNLVE